tara:strand:- start:8129 stop:8422 length:294 start_codon:yes stop_codon:yes gene_type:complete
MSALINLSIRVDKLPKEKFVQGKDGAVYYNFTVGINDETNAYGQNVTATDSQTKEEREAKKTKLYLGNGSVVWTDNNINVATKKEVETVEAGDDLPF